MSSTSSHKTPSAAASETIKLPLWKTWLAPYEAAEKQEPVFDIVTFRANSDALCNIAPNDKQFRDGLLELCISTSDCSGIYHIGEDHALSCIVS